MWVRMFDRTERFLARCALFCFNRFFALYHGGILTGAMGNGQRAQQWLSRLLEISPDYQDARDRLDKIKLISDNKGTNNLTASSPESGS